MKVIEPLGSGILLTALVYASGVAQYSAFMHAFGVHPMFSQPAIDKIFYDGGLLVFKVLIVHFCWVLVALAVFSIVLLVGVYVFSKWRSLRFLVVLRWLFERCSFVLGRVAGFGGIGVVVYLVFLTFSTYQLARADGAGIAQAFLSTCHVIRIEQDGDVTTGCAFSKDRDSVWYYTLEDSGAKASSRLLSEIDRITYLDPVVLK